MPNLPVTIIDGGLDLSKSSLAIEPRFCTDCSNVVIHDGIVEKRTGFVWDNDLDTATTIVFPDEYVLGFYHYENFITKPVKKFWMCGLIHVGAGDMNIGLYHFDPGDSAWAGITAVNSGLIDTSYDFYANFCEVVEETNDPLLGQPTGERLIVNVTPSKPSEISKGHNVLELTQTVDGAFGAVDTVPSAVGTAAAWSDGVKYSLGDVVTETNTYRCILTHTANNGDNKPGVDTNWANYWVRYYQISAIKTKRVLSYNGHLVCLGVNVVDGASATAVNAPHKIMWSKQWLYDDFDGPGSGWFYTYDTGGGVVNGELLKNTIVAFKTDSIWQGSAITVDPYIHWELRYPDIGLLAPRLLVKYGNALYFAGTNGFYVYTGGTELFSINSKKIWTSFLSDLKDGGVDVNRLYKWRSFATVHRDKGDILFWIPTGNSGWPNKAYIYNVFTQAWTTWTLPAVTTTDLVLTGWGEYEHDSDRTDSGFIPYYGGAMSTDGTPPAISLPKVLKYDYSTYTDATPVASTSAHTMAITATWTSKDFVTSLENDTNWMRVFTDMAGSSNDTVVTTSLITDGAAAVDATGGAQTLTTIFTAAKDEFNLAGYRAKVKYTDATSGKAMKLRAMEIKMADEGGE